MKSRPEHTVIFPVAYSNTFTNIIKKLIELIFFDNIYGDDKTQCMHVMACYAAFDRKKAW